MNSSVSRTYEPIASNRIDVWCHAIISVRSIGTICSVLSCRTLSLYTCICCSNKPIAGSAVYMRSYSILTICTIRPVLPIYTIVYSSNRYTIYRYCSDASTLRCCYYRTMTILTGRSSLSLNTLNSLRTLRTSITFLTLYTLNTLFSLRALYTLNTLRTS